MISNFWRVRGVYQPQYYVMVGHFVRGKYVDHLPLCRFLWHQPHFEGHMWCLVTFQGL